MTGQPFSCSPQVARSFVRALYHAHPPIDWMWQVPVTPPETGHRQGGGGQQEARRPTKSCGVSVVAVGVVAWTRAGSCQSVKGSGPV